MYESVNNILLNAGGLEKDKKTLIIYDDTTKAVADIFKQQAEKIASLVKMAKLPVYEQHGAEPPAATAFEMINSDLILCLTKNSLAHSQARLKANEAGASFLSLPDYSIEMLDDKSLRVNFKKFLPKVEKITDYFTNGDSIRVRSFIGTDLFLNIKKRKGNCCPGFVDNTYKLGSPPDVEANIAPVEDKSEGIIIIDGSITCPEIGLLEDAVKLEIENGKIMNFISENKAYVKTLNKMFDNEQKRVLAELGIGFNDEAKLCGKMLIDEGAAGYVHFGFGANSTIGGKNNTNFHLDFVMTSPTLYIDNETIIKDGSLTVI